MSSRRQFVDLESAISLMRRDDGDWRPLSDFVKTYCARHGAGYSLDVIDSARNDSLRAIHGLAAKGQKSYDIAKQVSTIIKIKLIDADKKEQRAIPADVLWADDPEAAVQLVSNQPLPDHPYSRPDDLDQVIELIGLMALQHPREHAVLQALLNGADHVEALRRRFGADAAKLAPTIKHRALKHVKALMTKREAS